MEDEVEDWWATQREQQSDNFFVSSSTRNGSVDNNVDTSSLMPDDQEELHNPFVARLAAQRERSTSSTTTDDGQEEENNNTASRYHTARDLNAHLGAPNMRGRKLGGLNDIFAKRGPILVGEDARIAKHLPDIVTNYADAFGVMRPSALDARVLDSFSHYMSTDLVIIKPHHAATNQPTTTLTTAQTEFIDMHKQLLTSYKRTFGPDSNNNEGGKRAPKTKAGGCVAAVATSSNASDTTKSSSRPGMEAEYLFVETSRYITLPRYYALSLYGPLILLPHCAPLNNDVQSLATIQTTTTAPKTNARVGEIPCHAFKFPLRPSASQIASCTLPNGSGTTLLDVRPRDTWRDEWIKNRKRQLQQEEDERKCNKANRANKKRVFNDMTWDRLNGEFDSDVVNNESPSSNGSRKSNHRRIIDAEHLPWPAPIQLFDMTQPAQRNSMRTTSDLLAQPNPLNDGVNMERLLRQQEEALRRLTIHQPELSNSPTSDSTLIGGPLIDMYTQPLRLVATLRTEPIDQLPIVGAIISQWRNATAAFRNNNGEGSILNATLPGCMVCLPCGVGKTIIAITAWLWALRDDFDPYFAPETFASIINRKFRYTNKDQRARGMTPLIRSEYVDACDENGRGIVEQRTLFASATTTATASSSTSTNDQTTTLPKLSTRDDLRHQQTARRTLRALFLIRTDDLIKQTMKAIQDLVPDVRVGIIQRDQRPKDPTAVDICVISTDTLAGQSFDPDYFSRYFSILLTDEAHWNQTDFFLQALRKLPVLYVASFTATPRDPRLPDLMGPVLVYRNRPYQPQQVKMIVYDCGRKLERRMLTGRGGSNNNQDQLALRHGIGSQNGIFDRQTQIADTTVDMRRNAWLAKLSMQVVCTHLPTHDEKLCVQQRKTWDDAWGPRLEWTSSTSPSNAYPRDRHMNNTRLVLYQRGGLMAAMDGIRSNTLEGDVVDNDRTRYTSFPPPKHKRPPLTKAMRQAHAESQRVEMAIIEAARRANNTSMEVEDPHVDDDDDDALMVHIRKQQQASVTASATATAPNLGLSQARTWIHKPVSRIITNDNLYVHHDPERMKRYSLFFSNSAQHLIMHQHWQAQQWIDTCTSVPREYLMIVRTNIRELSVVDVRALSADDWSHMRWLAEWRSNSQNAPQGQQSFCLAGNWLKAVRASTTTRNSTPTVPGCGGERIALTAPFPATGTWRTSLHCPKDAPLNQRTLGTIPMTHAKTSMLEQWQNSTVLFNEAFFTTWFAMFPACLKHSWETRTPLLADALVQKHKKAKKTAASVNTNKQAMTPPTSNATSLTTQTHTANRDLYMHLTDGSKTTPSTPSSADDDDISLNPSNLDPSSWMHVSQFYWTPIYGPLPMEQIVKPQVSDNDEGDGAVKRKSKSKKVREAEAAQALAEHNAQMCRAAAMTDALLKCIGVVGSDEVDFNTWMTTTGACPNDLKREMFKHAGDVPRALNYSTRPHANMPGTLATFGLLMGANYPVPKRCVDPAYFTSSSSPITISLDEDIKSSKTPLLKTSISPSHQTSVKACDYILATYEFGSTGLDIQRVGTCIQGTQETDNEQANGRGQRFMVNKQDFTLIDFVEPRFMYRNTALVHQKAHIAESATLEYYRIEYEHDEEGVQDDAILL